jgi:hypothetical protein
MWVQAGFPPNDFWQQTPRSFQLAMQGVRKRLENESQEQTRLAWEVGAFSAAAQAGKLKPLRHYLHPEKKAQAPREMLAALLAYQSGGAPMTIRKIERK